MTYMIIWIKSWYSGIFSSCCTWLGSSWVSLRAGGCCPSQICLFKNNCCSWQEVDYCFTCLACGKAKAFSHSVFGMRNGMALDMEVHIQWKAEWEGRRLDQRMVIEGNNSLKVFNSGNGSRLDMESLPGQTLLLSCMTEFLEKLSSLNIPKGILMPSFLQLYFLQLKFRAAFEHS